MSLEVTTVYVHTRLRTACLDTCGDPGQYKYPGRRDCTLRHKPMTLETLTVLYRYISDAAQIVAEMAQDGDPDAMELLQYLEWVDRALAAKLTQRLDKKRERAHKEAPEPKG
jgi:predicted amidophosphoribosyltransferase